MFKLLTFRYAHLLLVLALLSSLLFPGLHAYSGIELFKPDVNVLESSGASHKIPMQAQTALVSIPLQKEYVPMWINGKLTAYKATYYGHVYAGTPSKPFTVIFDSGSGQVILPSSTCLTSVCARHRRFNRSFSKSAIDVDVDGAVLKPDATERAQVGITFGTGEVRGEVVRDLVCLSRDADMCADVRMVLADEMSDDPFGLFDADGVVGLGLNSLALEPEFSFFGQMISHHVEMKPQFAIFLAPYDNGESVISFGGYDETRITSDVKWVPVVDPHLGYWQVSIKRIRMGNTVLDECEDGKCRAILDSGSSLLGVPRSVLRTVHGNLARHVGQEHLQVRSQIDCRMIPGRQIHFELGNHTITLGVEDYSRPSPWNLSKPATPEEWSLICRSLLTPTDMDIPLSPMTFIFGEPVLRRYYSVFDVAKKQIGFSRARDMPEGNDGLQALGAPAPGTLISGVGIPRAEKELLVTTQGAVV